MPFGAAYVTVLHPRHHILNGKFFTGPLRPLNDILVDVSIAKQLCPMSILQPDTVRPPQVLSEQPPLRLSPHIAVLVPTPTRPAHSPSPSPGVPQEPPAPSAAATGKTQTVFIHKLYDMLHDPTISHLIWWAPSHDSFCLLPGEDFSKVLSQYFKHTNIASFIRQLNMYGFHKVNDTFQNSEKESAAALAGGSSTTSANKWEFRHSANQFRKGDVDSLKLIKRRSSKNINSHKEVVNLKSLPPTSNPIGPPHYAYPPYYSEDESAHPGAHSRHHSADSLYHQALLVQHQTVLNGTFPPQPLGPPPQYKLPPTASTPGPEPPTQGSNHSTPQFAHAHPHEVPHGAPSPQGHAPLHYHPHIQHQQPQQPPSGAPVPPPLKTSRSFENSINFKFLDLNNQVNSLKNELSAMNSKYDTVLLELKRNLSDTLQILEMFENLIQSAPANDTQVKRENPEPESDRPTINSNIFNRAENNRTPVNTPATQALREKEDEVNTSPMSVVHSNKNPAGAAISNLEPLKASAPLLNEISKFKSVLLQRINQNTLNNVNISSNATGPAYHLNTPNFNSATSKKPSNSNLHIVPQYYPLNPHYTIYNPHRHPGKVSTSLLISNDEQQPGQPPSQVQQQNPRNMSVFVDPLQPIPSRQSKILCDENQPGPQGNQGSAAANSSNAYRMRAESKSYSPLTIGGANAGPTSSVKPNPSQPATMVAGAVTASPSQIGSSSSRSSIYDNIKGGLPELKNYRQYPFPNMSNNGTENSSGSNTPSHPIQSQLPPHTSAITHHHKLSGSRTNSLPNPQIDHTQNLDGAPTSAGPGNPEANHYHSQRNSFTSMYEHKHPHPSQLHYYPNSVHLPPPTPQLQPGLSSNNSAASGVAPLGALQKSSSASTSGSTIPTINTLRSDSPKPLTPTPEASAKLLDIDPQRVPSPNVASIQSESKNQLPSVSELDRSISITNITARPTSPSKVETKLQSLLHKEESPAEKPTIGENEKNETEPDLKKRKL
ncbi:uncharacterized protein CANTADRAFT_19624 [Suhomyces tanzawaensis NRRL Y-17324]|uniref:Heat shock transcription factor n=1 Tax=Suhomyces tanzawaensis NRRL Y-17324 TaxID=984487 RepID=A0A1E4SRA4_9ASCO|nr:uncharacterized protein CANTADRAFT_19624 [Suhomyces tanzawaensis NRRL Y-17324]ODV82031.1 hypothetical protein CANTADRAFT_19624 [Suhomyces tanzawaensis NRRL Y-17324]